jgi:[citrate (pro-3S)-lyase] ligase
MLSDIETMPAVFVELPQTQPVFFCFLLLFLVAVKNDPNSEVACADMRTEYLNIVNGHRVVPDFPASPSNTVRVFGDCIGCGFYAEDGLTFANQLQRLINEAGLSYGVRAPVSTIRHVGCLIERIKQMPPKEGDIVIFINGSRPIIHSHRYHYFDSLPNIFEHDLTATFGRPHAHGEVFLDYIHLNHRGQRMAAEYVFEEIVAKQKSRPPSSGTDNLRADSGAGGVPGKRTGEGSGGAMPESRPESAAYPYEGFSSDLADYLRSIREKSDLSDDPGGSDGPGGGKGAVVMNCNPFTLGHRHLIETAAKDVDRLYVFVVSEDRSEFSFGDRMEMVRLGVAHVKNAVVLPSGKLIISTVTFPGYFDSRNKPSANVDTANDLTIFAEHIAPALGISVRFIGHEPFSRVTAQYNRDMKEILPRYGIEVREIQRLTSDGTFISASEVRRLLRDGESDGVARLVPESTLRFLRGKKP